jgi:hypothetical protein
MIRWYYDNHSDGYRGHISFRCDTPGCAAVSPPALAIDAPTDGTEAWARVAAHDAGWRERLEGRMQRQYCPAHAAPADPTRKL